MIPIREWTILTGGSSQPGTCSVMYCGQYSQSDSAGGSTGTLRVAIWVYYSVSLFPGTAAADKPSSRNQSLSYRLESLR